jgi:uncharacterized protein (DUF433 family)
MQLPKFLTQDSDREIRLTGHRIGLYTVIRLFKEGRSAEAIADHLPTLPVDLIHAVLRFYQENQVEVDAYVEAYRGELEQQATATPPGPSTEELRRRWLAKGLGALP